VARDFDDANSARLQRRNTTASFIRRNPESDKAVLQDTGRQLRYALQEAYTLSFCTIECEGKSIARSLCQCRCRRRHTTPHRTAPQQSMQPSVHARDYGVVVSFVTFDLVGWMVKQPMKAAGSHKKMLNLGAKKKRYFHLHKGILRYYTDETKEPSKLKGSLKLTVKSKVNCKKATAFSSSYRLEIEVDPHRYLVAEVPNKQMALKWSVRPSQHRASN